MQEIGNLKLNDLIEKIVENGERDQFNYIKFVYYISKYGFGEKYSIAKLMRFIATMSHAAIEEELQHNYAESVMPIILLTEGIEKASIYNSPAIEE